MPPTPTLLPLLSFQGNESHAAFASGSQETESTKVCLDVLLECVILGITRIKEQSREAGASCKDVELATTTSDKLLYHMGPLRSHVKSVPGPYVLGEKGKASLPWLHPLTSQSFTLRSVNSPCTPGLLTPGHFVGSHILSCDRNSRIQDRG